MNESQLTDLLERAGERTAVGPAPIDAMRAGATRRRRRRTAVISFAAAVSVVAAVGGTALLDGPGAGSQKMPAATKGASHATSPVPTATNGLPTGGRLVGLGQVAIAVPQEWGTNQARCGTPQSDTVLINAWLTQACLVARPAGVESVEVGDGAPGPVEMYGFKADEQFAIDGVPAQRQRTACAPGSLGGPEVCTGIVYLPSTGVWFRVQSSTSAAQVDRVLEWIVVLPGYVGVPEYQPAISKDEGSAGRKYAELLRGLGLRVETKTVSSPDQTPGQLLEVAPFPGTMLPLGATVAITVVAKR